MHEPIDFKSLDPYLRAVALVGQYLQQWSSLESALNVAIGHAFGLTIVQEAIITKNMQLRDKLHALKTVLDFVEPDDPEGYSDTLTEIGNLMTKERNILAHEPFWQDEEGDGVQFIIVRARGKLSFPNTRWSIEDFETKYAKLFSLRQTVERIAVAVKPFANTGKHGLNPLGKPNAMFGGLGLLDPLPQNFLDILDLDPAQANPETTGGTQPSSDQ